MRLIIVLLLSCVSYAQSVQWKSIDVGFDVGTYQSPQLSAFDNSVITILKVDPFNYEFNLFHDSNRNNAKQWSDKYSLSAVINAGMFYQDGQNLGFMKQYDKVYNPVMNGDNAVLAFNPIDSLLPLIQIIDLKQQNWSILNEQYNSYTQSIRMTSINGQNLWAKRNKMWSIVVVAMDYEGNALFIHSRSPYIVHDFINIIMEAPLNIKNMMYLEGGPEATLYINHNGVELVAIGSYETNFFESNANVEMWSMPNIIGITKK